MTTNESTEQGVRGAVSRCQHCGFRFGFHEEGCPALIDDIVSVAITGFRDDVERIMADHPQTQPGDMTTEEQCAMATEASGWRARALKAEAALATLSPDDIRREERGSVKAIARIDERWSRELDDRERFGFAGMSVNCRDLRTILAACRIVRDEQ
jgi:hypothetical protein